MKFPFDLSANKIKIIDVGARAVPEGFHYEALVDSNACVVTAVEPDAKANKWLTNRAIDKIHNVAIGDGGIHEMHVCQLASCSSMLAPNKACLEFYSGMEFFYRVEKINTIKTYGFDVVFSDAYFDYLDIDVQGYELEVLKSGGRNIKNLLGIHIEVSFVEKYVGQPLFRDVDVFLAERDFTFHCFTGYGTRSPRGVKVDGSSVNGINQWLWADAFYFHRLDDNEFWGVSNRLVKLACIFHCVYKSYDFAVHALKRCDQLGGSVYCHEYVRYLQEMGVDVEEGEDSEWIMDGMIKKLSLI